MVCNIFFRSYFLHFPCTCQISPRSLVPGLEGDVKLTMTPDTKVENAMLFRHGALLRALCNRSEGGEGRLLPFS